MSLSNGNFVFDHAPKWKNFPGPSEDILFHAGSCLDIDLLSNFFDSETDLEQESGNPITG